MVVDRKSGNSPEKKKEIVSKKKERERKDKFVTSLVYDNNKKLFEIFFQKLGHSTF